MKIKRNTKKKGFTLIELIIVLAVMAIIAAIAIPNFVATRDNARKKADAQSCETIKRMILSEVVEGTLESGNVFTYTPSEAAGSRITDSGATALKADVDTLMEASLRDTKEPQYKNTISDDDGDGTYDDGAAAGTPRSYTVTITSSGEVQVATN